MTPEQIAQSRAWLEQAIAGLNNLVVRHLVEPVPDEFRLPDWAVAILLETDYRVNSLQDGVWWWYPPGSYHSDWAVEPPRTDIRL